MRRFAKTGTIIFCVLLSFLFVFPISVFATEQSLPPPSLDEASAVLLYHLESRSIALSKNEDINIGAGSAVKVLSGLLFCEKLYTRLDDEITVTIEHKDAFPSPLGHSLKLETGDTVSIRQLLKAAICGSYNDAFYILATEVAGSITQFVEYMNQRARALKMNETTIWDITGLVAGSRTTVLDMVNLMEEAYKNQLFMELSSLKSFEFSSLKIEKKTIYNRNDLVCSYQTHQYYNKYCQGMSAGSTSADGNCVLTVVKFEKETYFCVVLGGQETERDSFGYRIVNRLIDWAYNAYEYVEVLSPDYEICKIPVTLSDRITEVGARVTESLFVRLPKGVDTKKEITYSIRLTAPEIEAPFEENFFVGYVAVIHNGNILKTLELYTTAGTEKSAVMSFFQGMQKCLKNRAVAAGLICFLVLITAWILWEYVTYSHRRKKWNKYFSDKIMVPELMNHSSDKERNKKHY